VWENTVKQLKLLCLAFWFISSTASANDFSIPTTITKPVPIKGPVEVKVIEPSPTPVQLEKAVADDQRETRDVAAQEAMAFWSVLLFAATAIQTAAGAAGIYFVWATLEASRDANRATLKSIEQDRGIGHAQLRPYVSADPLLMFTELVNDRDLMFELRVSNNGQTPALAVNYSTLLQTERVPFPGWDPASFEKPPAGRMQNARIAAGRHVSSYGVIALTKEQLQVVLDGTYAVYIGIRLSYTDVFKEDYKENLLWQMMRIPVTMEDGRTQLKFLMRELPEFATYS
jgi:hypothetical protein